MRTILLQLVLLTCGAAGSGSAARRLVAVADLHGDLGATMRVLQLAGLVDAHGGWTGGDAVLVQTGDIVDRGGEAKQIYELFRRLAEQAPSEGGEVHNLLGNHDAMNVLGDLRYVNQTDYAHFGGARARARAFSSAGDLGQWLRSRPVALHLGDTVFVHAGITAAWAAQGLDAINALMRAALSGAGGMSTRASVLGASGPVWYRGYHEQGEEGACAEARRALSLLGATRMVVGHSIQAERVCVRCGGHVHLIDIAMSSAIRGAHVVAWECRGCLEGSGAAGEPSRPPTIRALYDDGTEPLATGFPPALREDL